MGEDVYKLPRLGRYALLEQVAADLNREVWAATALGPVSLSMVCLKVFSESKCASANDRQERQSLRLGPPSCAYDFEQLRQCIMDIKSDHPDESRIVISGERGTDYDVLIQTMDTARGGDDELFPDVSIAASVA